MPPLTGAAEWLNAEPLGPAELRGHVVLVNLWTRTPPPRRARCRQPATPHIASIQRFSFSERYPAHLAERGADLLADEGALARMAGGLGVDEATARRFVERVLVAAETGPGAGVRLRLLIGWLADRLAPGELEQALGGRDIKMGGDAR